MRKILSIAIALALALPASAQVLIKKGKTDVRRYVVLVDSTTGAPETGYTITNLDLQYTREGAAPAAKADATALAATDSVHADNKAIEIDATSSPGLYRVDWPDAAFATGADRVYLVVSGAGIHPAIEEVHLVDFDPQDAVRLGLTALPNAAAEAAGGLYTRGSGAGQINQAANGMIDADMVAISTDATAANNFETMLDGTGGQTLTLKNLVVNNPTANAVDITAGGTGKGVNISSDATAVSIESSTTDGVQISAGGIGLWILGNEDGVAISGAIHGISTGGGDGHGIFASGGGSGGDGIHAVAAAANGHGLMLDGGATGDDISLAGDDAPDLSAVVLGAAQTDFIEAFDNDGTGGDFDLSTLSVTGGATIANSGGTALTIASTGSNGNGILVTGFGTGEGASIRGGADGSGFEVIGGASSGSGFVGLATASSGHGMLLDGGASGDDISLAGVDAPNLSAVMFTNNSGSSYAAAHANSVVKQIADNAGGSGLTVEDIVDGVWDEATSGHTTAGTTGKAITDAGSAGNPWSSLLADNNVPDTFGELMNDIDAAPDFDELWTGSLVAAAVDTFMDLISASLPAGNDPNRTWVMRRGQTARTIAKSDNEAPVFWADVSRLLGASDFITGTPTVTASGCTITSVDKIGDFIYCTIAGGTVGATVDVVFTFNSSAGGAPIVTRGSLRIVD